MINNIQDIKPIEIENPHDTLGICGGCYCKCDDDKMICDDCDSFDYSKYEVLE